jgi:hypothetical protein
MDTWESFRMAGKTLAANRLRSTLTMLGIIIGNASVILMVGSVKAHKNMLLNSSSHLVQT